MDPIEVNLPFPKGRVPVCGCDMKDAPPTKLQRLGCRLRGGPCAPQSTRGAGTPQDFGRPGY